MNYAEAPHVVTWELTRACKLHCQHCRAQASLQRHPDELSLNDMVWVLDDLATSFSRPPILVFTGGDPLERPDLSGIIGAAVERGLVTALAPSVTPRLTEEVIREWKKVGVHSVSLSLDGMNAPTHDRFRGFPGTFDRTLEMADVIVREGLALQLNTSIGPKTVMQLTNLANLVKFLPVTSWELFFVIPVGRARPGDALSADHIEKALLRLADYALDQPFRITVVGAPHWARVVHQLQPDAPMRMMAREAKGFAFIDHLGNVYPSGYLPVPAGNVRHRAFSDVYRDSPLFRMLREPRHFEGACGTCDYRDACGGSRARAYAMTGNILAADPGCIRTRIS